MASGDLSLPQLFRALSLNPRTFKVREPNTALFYFLGTIGPYLLVILIVWFFIIRQMRAPGGSGGVLSFGRSRAARLLMRTENLALSNRPAGNRRIREHVARAF